ncbi:MAG TPA: formylglycine-generating enzyme family protein [Rhizomicrobium sp.]|jgi:formylglycine-generating enzyme required for sulfatase activity|nr:formylglycine-generating enzyme family protein [Rhizomicrobium sp.]
MLRRASLFLVLLAAFAGIPAVADEHKEREFQECTDCPVMVGIPAGDFVMGSPAGEAGRFDAEGPQHRVAIRAFALGKFDVTTAEFLDFLRDTGYQPEPCNETLTLGWHSPGRGLAYPRSDAEPPTWPATCVSWKDAQAYIAWLNAKARAANPSIGRRAGPYRLPSEAEWEFAARAGTTTSRWWGNTLGTNNANCNGCGSKADDRVLTDVDSFSPNPFGLYGVLGNAWQWTADCWHKSYVGAPADGSAWLGDDCGKHVLRGGSFDNVPVFIRSAARTAGGGKDYDYSSLAGFRVARTLP